MCGYHWAKRGNYFGGKPAKRIEVVMRVKKRKYGKTAHKGEVTCEMMVSRG